MVVKLTQQLIHYFISVLIILVSFFLNLLVNNNTTVSPIDYGNNYLCYSLDCLFHPIFFKQKNFMI